MVNVHPDVSEYQVAATNAFNRRFLMFRADSEYDRPDAKASANLGWSIAVRAAGRIDNFGVYVLPGFVSNAAIIARLDALGVPRDCVVMIDWERWGQLAGDFSAVDNDLANKLRARQNGRADLVWGYSNRGDLSGWPTRPSWLGFIISGYNSNDPRDEGIGNVIGWQYTNGTENHTANPSSTPPFGACDHNVMFIDYPKPGATTEGLLMTLSAAQQEEIYTALHDPNAFIRNALESYFAGTGSSRVRIAVQTVLGLTGVDAAAKTVSDPTSGLLVRVAQLQADLAKVATTLAELSLAAGDPAAIKTAAHDGAASALDGATIHRAA